MKAGGELALLYHAWKAAGHCPYCLYNGLGPDYRPLNDPDAQPHPPPFVSRFRNVIYGFAAVSAEAESKRM